MIPIEGGEGAIETAAAAQPLAHSRVARFLDPFIFYSLIAVIALTAIPYGTVEPWWKAVFQCAVFALAILSVVEGLLSKQWFVKRYRLLIPLLVMVGFAVIQMTIPLRNAATAGGASVWRPISFSPYDTQLFVYQFAALIVATGLLIRHTTSRQRLKTLIYLVIGIGVASTFFALVRHATQRTPGFFLPYLQPDLGDGMPGVGYGQFINRNHFAFLAEASLGVLLGLLVGRVLQIKYLLLAVSATILMSVALIYSGSRGGLVAMVGEVLFLALLVFVIEPGRELLQDRAGNPGRGRRIGKFLIARTALLAFLIVVMVIGIVRVGGDPLAERLQAAPQEEFANPHDKYAKTFRLKIWPTTWSLIKDHPIAGVGLGGYWIAVSQYHMGSGEFTPQQAHNDYLELLASGGLIAIVIGLWFIVLFLQESFLSLRASDPFLRASRFGALAGMFAVAIHSTVDFGLHVTINTLVFVVLVVIATARVRAIPSTGSGSSLKV